MNSILFGLAAALGWGAADFVGGFAARRMSAFKLVTIGWIIGLFALPLTAWLTAEPYIEPLHMLFTLIAGLLGSSGIILFYHALSVGRMSLVAPITGLLTGIIPVIVAFFLQGLPRPVTLIGILLALVAVLFVSNEGALHKGITIKWSEIKYALLCGVVFGFYLVFMPLGSPYGPFWPMTFTHISGVTLLLITAYVTKRNLRPVKGEMPFVWVNFTLDMVGTVCFILATQSGRLDVATVLSSLYPGITILLAAIVLKEHLMRSQQLGVLLALVAIGLLSA